VNHASLTQYPVGETWIFDIGVAEIEQSYLPGSRMHYKVLTGPRAGSEETLPIETQLIRPGVFLVSWQEHDGTTVTHVEDFDSNTFHSRATLADHRFMRITGRMRRAG
jgi:hypothetical protein